MSSLPWIDDQMAIGIDLYRTDDYLKAGRIDLSSLLSSVFEELLGQPLDDAQFVLYFHAVADLRELGGTPSVVNLRASHGFVNVQIMRNGSLLYQHPHSVREVVARPLQKILAEADPTEDHWGFGISGPGLEKVGLVRPAPHNVGGVQVSTGGGQHRIFHLEAMPDKPLQKADLADFGVSNVETLDAKTDRVILSPEVHEGMLRSMEFSRDVEEGGFLVGRVFEDSQRPGNHFIEVVEAVPAERTGASFLQFTFTGESFLRINDAVDRRGQDQRLVGWYHTHLFGATDKIGLSSIDVELHARTFLRPWHVAGLVNIAGDTRTLRFYGWDGVEMTPRAFWARTS